MTINSLSKRSYTCFFLKVKGQRVPEPGRSFDRLFKVNSALKLILSVIEDQFSGGQRSSK